MPEAITVLIADDSAFRRKALTAMVSSDPRLRVVGVARNGEEAIQKVAELHPAVVTMDVEMPGMNGLEALRRIMEIRPVPVVMVSSVTREGARETIKGLELGAVDVLSKPLDGPVTGIAVLEQELTAKIIAAAAVKGKIRALPPPCPAPSAARLSPACVAATRGAMVVAIGCSTGGPQALLEILPALPKDFGAGILIVQHMPKFFTRPFAERLDQASAIEVREACEGDLVTPGLALVAPAGVHMRVVRRRAIEVEIALSADTRGEAHVPSVDVLMESVAEVYGERAVGLLLTGMGHDGVLGMKAIKGAKGRTLAQDEASSLVYGMPKAAVEGGHADKVVGLPMLAAELANMV